MTPPYGERNTIAEPPETMRETAQDSLHSGPRRADAPPRPFRPTPPAGSDAASDRSPSSTVEPVELSRWIDGRKEGMVARWLGEMESRSGGPEGEVLDLYGRFAELLVSCVSAALGPYRDQVDPLLQQVAELYGSLGTFRGLAAGEVVEEVQLLREVVIRFLYADPPEGGEGLLSLRDVLRLNRALDRAVSRASVGHTDALFFALFKGSGVPDRLPGEQFEEVRDQLSALRDDFDGIMEHLRER